MSNPHFKPTNLFRLLFLPDALASNIINTVRMQNGLTSFRRWVDTYGRLPPPGAMIGLGMVSGLPPRSPSSPYNMDVSDIEQLLLEEDLTAIPEEYQVPEPCIETDDLEVFDLFRDWRRYDSDKVGSRSFHLSAQLRRTDIKAAIQSEQIDPTDPQNLINEGSSKRTVVGSNGELNYRILTVDAQSAVRLTPGYTDIRPLFLHEDISTLYFQPKTPPAQQTNVADSWNLQHIPPEKPPSILFKTLLPNTQNNTAEDRATRRFLSYYRCGSELQTFSYSICHRCQSSYDIDCAVPVSM